MLNIFEKLLQPLEQAIIARSWDDVIAAYQELTGKSITQESGVVDEIDEDEVLPVDEPEESEVVEQQDADTTPPELLSEKPVPKRPKKKVDLDSEAPVDGDDEDGGRNENRVRCRRMSFTLQKRKNNYTDNLTEAAADLEFDKKVLSKAVIASRKSAPKRRVLKAIRVTCDKCNRQFEVDPLLAPRRITTEDSSSYVCNKCIVKQRPNRGD